MDTQFELVKSLVIFVSFFVALSALKIPSYITTCSRNDPKLNECVLKAGRAAIPHFIHGDPKFGIPSIDPLDIQQISMRQGTKQVGFNLIIEDCKLHGLGNAVFTNARTDLKKRHIEWDFDNKHGIQILGKYNASGQVLFVPITGNGKANITILGIKCTMRLDFELIKKKGKEYINFTRSAVPTELGGAQIRLDNLFNGDKLLGENMNRFLNENWKEVAKEIGPELETSLGEVFRRLLSNVMSQVPYDQVFPDTRP